MAKYTLAYIETQLEQADRTLSLAKIKLAQARSSNRRLGLRHSLQHVNAAEKRLNHWKGLKASFGRDSTLVKVSLTIWKQQADTELIIAHHATITYHDVTETEAQELIKSQLLDFSYRIDKFETQESGKIYYVKQ